MPRPSVSIRWKGVGETRKDKLHMYRKLYPRIGLLAGLLAIAMMTTISTSADARSGATPGPTTVSQGSRRPTPSRPTPGKFKSRLRSTRQGDLQRPLRPDHVRGAGRQGRSLKGAVAGKVIRPGHAAKWVSQSTTMAVKNASVDSHELETRPSAVARVVQRAAPRARSAGPGPARSRRAPGQGRARHHRRARRWPARPAAVLGGQPAQAVVSRVCSASWRPAEPDPRSSWVSDRVVGAAQGAGVSRC